MTTDLKAANYVLFNSYDFQKPEVVRGIIRGLFGSGAFCCIIWRILMMTLLLFLIGLLSVEGDQHRHQVRLFFFQDLFTNRCLILQVAQDFGQSCWVSYWDVKYLTIG